MIGILKRIGSEKVTFFVRVGHDVQMVVERAAHRLEISGNIVTICSIISSGYMIIRQSGLSSFPTVFPPFLNFEETQDRREKRINE